MLSRLIRSITEPSANRPRVEPAASQGDVPAPLFHAFHARNRRHGAGATECKSHFLEICYVLQTPIELSLPPASAENADLRTVQQVVKSFFRDHQPPVPDATGRRLAAANELGRKTPGDMLSHSDQNTRMSRMIINARRVGQLGNRLTLSAHLIACAQEHGVELVNPAFNEYACFFRSTQTDLLCRYPVCETSARPGLSTRKMLYASVYHPTRLLVSLRCHHFPLKVIRISIDQQYDLRSDEFVNCIKSRKFVFLQGWGFRDPVALERHAQPIRDYFRPIPVHEDAAHMAASSARGTAEVLVGVHIRHGDYQRYLGGKYFYTLAQYRHVMTRIQRLLAPRNVSFLVCSNVPWERQAFEGLSVSFGTGQLVEDMYAFSHCDYLIGPPSTFTTWASFYGQVPLFSLEHPDQEFELDDFRQSWL